MKIGRDKFRHSVVLLFCKNQNSAHGASPMFFSEKPLILLSKCQVPVKLNCNIFQKFKVGFKMTHIELCFQENTDMEFPSQGGCYFIEKITIKIQKFPNDMNLSFLV